MEQHPGWATVPQFQWPSAADPPEWVSDLFTPTSLTLTLLPMCNQPGRVFQTLSP